MFKKEHLLIMSSFFDFAKLFKYAIVGIISNSIIYTLFIVILYVGLSPVMSAFICYVTGIFGSYFFNKNWTFKSSNSHAKEAPKYIISYAIGLVVNLVTIKILILYIRPEIAQLINILVNAFVIYGSLWILKFGGK